MSTKFFTNKADNSLLKKFEGVFKNLPNIHNFDALVGYFRATGYFKLRPFLNEIPEIRILVGINVDTLIQKYHSLGQQYLKNPQETKDKFIESLKVDIEKADYNKEIEEGIIQLIYDITNEKIQIKAHPEKNLHAKIYIFKPKEFNKYSTGSVITGSSNLTEPGLGSRDKSNYEFNVELRDYDDILTHTDNDNICTHIESILDMMVYELYFTEYMKEKGLKVLEYINPKPFTEETTNEQKAVIIKNFYEWYQEPENAVRQRMLLIETRSPDILAVINGAT